MNSGTPQDRLRELTKAPHRRFNPLTREWVLVSPHRTDRPWQGRVEPSSTPALEVYDPACYLCPGNRRAGAAINPSYAGTFVFENDFPALKPGGVLHEVNELNGVIRAETESGVCKVICFSPRHDLTLSRMNVEEIEGVVVAWTNEYVRLGSDPNIQYVQIFENRGEMMGCSNPHPHGQIWASRSIPNEPAKEQDAFKDHIERNGTCLLCSYTAYEIQNGERVVCENRSLVAIVPFWAVWPFEILLVSKEHLTDLSVLNGEARSDLAEILGRVTGSYDRLFLTSFPYSMGFHQRPTDAKEHKEWHLHAHFYPPLLRSATVRKFMVGYEMLGSPQRDITPESAAERLRACQSRP